jgi:hypothetical protein
MQADNTFRSHDYEGLFPARPESLEDDPKESVRKSNPWLRALCLENRELLPQSEDFQKQGSARTENTWDQAEEETQRSEHEVVLTELAPCKSGRKQCSPEPKVQAV